MLNPETIHLRQAIERPLDADVDSTLSALLAGADEWAIHLDTARVLAKVILHLRPTSVLEFGAGRSSLVAAAALEKCGGGRLTSIEHQPAFAQQAWARMSDYPRVDGFMCETALAQSIWKHGLMYRYKRLHHALTLRGPHDCVFIDAPPGDFGRDATLLDCAPSLAAGAVVVVDDYRRHREQSAVRRWQRALPIEIVSQIDNERGTAVLRLSHRSEPEFSVKTFMGTFHDRVISLKGY